LLGVLAVLGGSPSLADDDDGGGGGGAGGGAGGGGGGGAGGGDGPDGNARMPLGGAPPSGRVLQDLRSFLGAFTPGAAAPPAPPPAPVAVAPAAAPRPAQPPARPDSIPRELAIIGLDDAALARLQAAGFTVIEEAPAGFLPGRVARLGLPTGLSAAAARDRARALAPAARVDLNHLYRPGQAAPMAGPAMPLATPTNCPAARIGMIDTGIDPDAPALAGLPIERVTRRGAGRAPSSPTHGTAVAALLAAQLGQAPILAIDAFHRGPDGDVADAFDLAAALGLMLQQGVLVVNLSFAGPANEVLALATERAAASGLLLAAAAGNEGQASPPRYPAAYPWVIAVTAVDRERRPFIRAGRGSHVAFAAPGVGLPAPAGRGTLSGTSYAVPFVAAAYAQAMVVLDAPTATQRLARAALDLGAPGRDPVYGHGLVRPLPGCGAG
jgi:hypothetical protein